jgi:hypothetical protein
MIRLHLLGPRRKFAARTHQKQSGIVHPNEFAHSQVIR